MSDHSNCAVPQFLATLETGTNQRRADAVALMSWYHRHWGEPHDLEAGMRRERNWRKHDVAYYGSILFGDK